MSNRRPSPPLLRPPRRSLRPVLLGLLFCLASAVGGTVLGLRLRPPASPVPASAPAPGLDVARTADAPGASQASVLSAEIDRLNAELAGLRRAVQEEQARIDALARGRAAAEAERQAQVAGQARARTAAEAQLAALQRDIAQAQRDRDQAVMQRDQVSAQRDQAAAQRDQALAAREGLSAPSPMPRDAAPPPPSRRDVAALPPVVPGPRPPPAAAAGPTRVFIHHRAGSSAASEAAAALLGPLREGGFDVSDVRPAAAVPFQRVVRYFYAEDAATAARLAGRLGRGWAIQDFRGYEPSPSPGTLEVWVPDR